MKKKNADIRAAAKTNGVFLWEIADKLGVSEPTFNRMLRKEMSDSDKAKALTAVAEIKGEHDSEND